MEFWYTLIIIFHVLVALALIGIVLIQHGKGADMGTGFGSGASGSVFGSRGATSFLSKVTALLAATFFATSILLAVLADKAFKVEDVEGDKSSQESSKTNNASTKETDSKKAGTKAADDSVTSDDAAEEVKEEVKEKADKPAEIKTTVKSVPNEAAAAEKPAEESAKTETSKGTPAVEADKDNEAATTDEKQEKTE